MQHRPSVLLWDKITSSSTADEIRGLYPSSSGKGPIYIGQVHIASTLFDIEWSEDSEVGPKVCLFSSDFPTYGRMDESTESLLQLYRQKYKRGMATIRGEGVVRKVWNKAGLRVQLTSLREPALRIIIEYFTYHHIDRAGIIMDVLPDIAKI